jgi:hypothetical protein
MALLVITHAVKESSGCMEHRMVCLDCRPLVIATLHALACSFKIARRFIKLFDHNLLRGFGSADLPLIQKCLETGPDSLSQRTWVVFEASRIISLMGRFGLAGICAGQMARPCFFRVVTARIIAELMAMMTAAAAPSNMNGGISGAVWSGGGVGIGIGWEFWVIASLMLV